MGLDSVALRPSRLCSSRSTPLLPVAIYYPGTPPLSAVQYQAGAYPYRAAKRDFANVLALEPTPMDGRIGGALQRARHRCVRHA
jgi:hypothetical protein